MSATPHILITRPLGQQQPFIEQLEALGLSVSHLPCLEIEALRDTTLDTDLAERYDSVLFTSVNAVRQAHRQRPLPWVGLAVHAIGAATGAALQRLGQPLAFLPDSPYNSESFLAQISTCRAGRLLLVKGCAGRGLLGPGLQKLGWQVASAEVYRRRLPRIPAAQVTRIVERQPPDLISITSNETLENLVTLAAAHLPRLQALPLVVNSARAAELAQELGFRQAAMIAVPPGDQGQLDCIRRWLHR
ncbi:uroporphyrinogen-III synthase [Granulosicoccus sp. 3-233]|uniref:uroporphyrinogen-III synthase n=1 Tax=Granulosicoccus sp. 3-233 TaxID=3417969 RepID=UPI003D352646